ncbi:MAG: NAD(P)/FAD-dependent oxidoreductase [Fimbriimonadaceae bacterium]
MSKQAVVVGAGLGGLVAAIELQKLGWDVSVLEASSEPGGRLKTDEVEGFTLDRGFQVLLESYPTAAEMLDYEKLNLKPFHSGAHVYDGRRLVTVDGKNPIGTLFNPYFSFQNKWMTGMMNIEVRGTDDSLIFKQPDMTAEAKLRAHGYKDDFLDQFARPFFGPVMHDPELQTSSRYLSFLWKHFSAGRTSLPQGGIAKIVQQLVEKLPGRTIECGVKVDEVRTEADGRFTVVCGDGSTRVCDAVVLATEAPEAARLSGQEFPTEGKDAVYLWFDAAQAPVEDKMIVVNAASFRDVNLVAPVSNIDPKRAPSGRHLVCVGVDRSMNTMDDGTLISRVVEIIRSWGVFQGVGDWRCLRVDRIPYAQLDQPMGVYDHLPDVRGIVPGIYFGGEFARHGSIEGAMLAGKNAAEAVEHDFAAGGRLVEATLAH